MGRSEGWTYGNVTQTCSDRSVINTNITYLCQIVADYGSAGGDSGAPVFEILSGDNVALLGIHWGRNDQTGERIFSYTSMITGHLGGSTVFYWCSVNLIMTGRWLVIFVAAKAPDRGVAEATARSGNAGGGKKGHQNPSEWG